MINHLEVQRSGYFFRTQRQITNAAIDTLFRSLRAHARQPSQNLFKASREEHGGARYSTICFSYERGPSFLAPEAAQVERVFGYILLVEAGPYVALFKSGLDLTTAFKSTYLEKVPSERVERAIARHDAIFEKLRLRNMSLSPLALRSKSLEGRDLENAVATSSASRFIPQGYSVRRPDGTYSATPSTGRISVRADRTGVEQLVEWASEISVQLDADAGQVSSFIRNFARPLELSAIPPQVHPTFVGIDVMGLSSALFDDQDGIRLVKSDGGAPTQLIKAEAELVLAALDMSFPIIRRGRAVEVRRPGGGNPAIATLQIGKSRIALRGLTLPELEGITVESQSRPLGEDPEARTLARHIDRENLFTVLFSDLALAYIDGALFRDEALAGGGAYFLAHLHAAPSLAEKTSEKGDFDPEQTAFADCSVFRAVVDDIASDDVLLCDDLGDEWADFIGISTATNPTMISFYHAKHGAPSLSASAFHESVGQAIKNLGRMTLPGEMLEAKLNTWDDRYRNARVQTQISRMVRGGIREDIAAKIEAVRAAPDTFRRVFIVTSSLSRAQVEGVFAAAAEGTQAPPHFVQLYWLLMSYFSACTEVGVQGYVVCQA